MGASFTQNGQRSCGIFTWIEGALRGRRHVVTQMKCCYLKYVRTHLASQSASTFHCLLDPLSTPRFSKSPQTAPLYGKTRECRSLRRTSQLPNQLQLSARSSATNTVPSRPPTPLLSSSLPRLRFAQSLRPPRARLKKTGGHRQDVC